MLIVKGWASTSAIDAEDHSFDGDAIRWPSFGGLTPPIELLYRHRASQPAGRIRTLERRATHDGKLGIWCEATVSSSFVEAPFSGFSVATNIQEYEIKQGHRGPYALIKSAILTEVSLVPNPCNPDCTILEREEWNEITPMLLEQINKLRALQRAIEQHPMWRNK